MFYVDLLRSINFPDQTYIGFTEDLKARMRAHNAGESKHTAKYAPWELECYFFLKIKEKHKNLNIILKQVQVRHLQRNAFGNKFSIPYAPGRF